MASVRSGVGCCRAAAEPGMCESASAARARTLAALNISGLDGSAARSRRQTRRKQARKDLAASVSAPPTATLRLCLLLDRDDATVDEHVPYARALFEKVAVSDDDVGNLSFLQRAEAFGCPRNSRRIDRQRANGG